MRIHNAVIDSLVKSRPIHSYRQAKYKVPKIVELNPDYSGAAVDDTGVNELRETIYACCQTSTEAQIVEWLEAGATKKEAAQRANEDYSKVLRMMRTIEDRYDKRTDEWNKTSASG